MNAASTPSPTPTTSEAVMGGAAMAVGMLLAGVAVARRSRFGIVAGLGLAALAGYSLMRRGRQTANESAAPAPSDPWDLPEEFYAPQTTPVVAATTLAEAAPVAEVAVAPTPAPVAEVPSAPLSVAEESTTHAPLIWEAGDSGSWASPGSGETVWFGLQDVKLDPASLMEAPVPPQVQAQPVGEVAMEGDLSPLTSVFVGDYPPAPELESGAPPVSDDVAALIQALNPPPLSSAMLHDPSLLLGSGSIKVSESSSEIDLDGPESDAPGFLMDELDAPAPAERSNSPLASASY